MYQNYPIFPVQLSFLMKEAMQMLIYLIISDMVVQNNKSGISSLYPA